MNNLTAITLIFASILVGVHSEITNEFGPSAFRQSVDITLPTNDKSSIRIAFGSCYGIRDFKSDIFETIADDKPDLWIWLGDVAYVDGSDWSSIIFGGSMDK